MRALANALGWKLRLGTFSCVFDWMAFIWLFSRITSIDVWRIDSNVVSHAYTGDVAAVVSYRSCYAAYEPNIKNPFVYHFWWHETLIQALPFSYKSNEKQQINHPIIIISLYRAPIWFSLNAPQYTHSQSVRNGKADDPRTFSCSQWTIDWLFTVWSVVFAAFLAHRTHSRNNSTLVVLFASSNAINNNEDRNSKSHQWESQIGCICVKWHNPGMNLNIGRSIAHCR